MPDNVPLTHSTTRTQRQAEGGTLYGWTCSCGELALPRFAAPEDADRAAARHTDAACPRCSRSAPPCGFCDQTPFTVLPKAGP